MPQAPWCMSVCVSTCSHAHACSCVRVCAYMHEFVCLCACVHACVCVFKILSETTWPKVANLHAEPLLVIGEMIQVIFCLHYCQPHWFVGFKHGFYDKFCPALWGFQQGCKDSLKPHFANDCCIIDIDLLE